MDRWSQSTLKTTICSIFTVITVGPLIYYAHCEYHRKCEIKKRKRRFESDLKSLKSNQTKLQVDHHQSYKDELEEIVKTRYASLQIGGRFQNPFEEWREQGAWEWAFWHLIYKPLTGRSPLFFNHGIPTGSDALNTLSNTLPQETPNWQHLFSSGTHSNFITNVHSHETPDEVLGKSWDRLSSDVGSSTRQSSDQSSSSSSPSLNLRQDKPIRVSDEFSFTWIGQSTCYVQLEGLCILTDPTFSIRTMESFMAPSRLRSPPCELKDLLRIDVVIVSHSHYDHLDIKAVQSLANSVLWIIPLGLGSWFRQQGVTNFREMNWWDKTQVEIPGSSGRNVTIVACPTMHWSARTPLDTNQSLWNSFAVLGDHTRFFHVGDTGYCSNLFNQIGELYGPFDLAAIPIGSYEPLWHLSSQHTDPIGSVKIMVELQAKMAIGVHWGTWMMSDETYDSPLKDLRKAVSIVLGDDHQGESRFKTVPMGRTLVFKSNE